MRRITPLLLLLVAIPFCLTAEPVVVWENYFDGPESEKLLDIEIAPDGGIVLLGEIVVVDSVEGERQFTSSVPFLMEIDTEGVNLWHHYFSGFWDGKGESQDLKILSVADSGVVFGGVKKNALVMLADTAGTIKELSSFDTKTVSKDEAATDFSWEISKYYRGERIGNKPRMVDSLDIRFMWTGENRALLRERTMALQWRPSRYSGWENGDLIIQGTARQPVTEIRTGINALLYLNNDMTTRWIRLYDDPDKQNFWPDGNLICALGQRLFIFSNPSFGNWHSSFHIVEIDTENGERLYSHGFDRERMHIVDYLSLPGNEFILAGTIFKMFPGNNHVDHRSFDYWLMKVRLP